MCSRLASRAVLVGLLCGPLWARGEEPALAAGLRAALHIARVSGPKLEAAALSIEAELLEFENDVNGARSLLEDGAARFPTEPMFNLRLARIRDRQCGGLGNATANILFWRVLDAAPFAEASYFLARGECSGVAECEAGHLVRAAVQEDQRGQWRSLAERRLSQLQFDLSEPPDQVWLSQVIKERSTNARQALRRLRGRTYHSRWAQVVRHLEQDLTQRLDDVPARDTSRCALDDAPEDPHVHLRFGAYLQQRGESERAREPLLRSWTLAHLPETAWRLGQLEVLVADGVTSHTAREWFAWVVALEGPQGHWRGLALDRLVKDGSLR